MNSKSVLAAVAIVMGTAACYTQRPLENPMPEPATRVIARVTDSGAVAIGGRVGPGAVEVEGVVAEADASEWKLNLLRVEYRGGNSILWNRELVVFPRNALTGATERRVSKSRSWMAAGMIVAGAFLASRAFSHVGSDENKPTEPTPQNIRIPLGIPGG